MALPKLIQNTWCYSSSYAFARQGSARTLAILSGSRYVCSPSDDKENASVISDLLVFEKKKQSKQNVTPKSVPNTPVKPVISQPKTSVSGSNSRKSKYETLSVLSEKEVISQMRAIKTKKTTYIVNESAAETLVKHLKKDLKPGDIIAEAHLGIGALTQVLLNHTDNKIIGYEPNVDFLMHLTSQFEDCASRLELHSLDLFKFYWYYTISKREPDLEGEDDKLTLLLNPLPLRDCQGVSSVKIVSSICDIAFFHKLTLSFTFQCCFFKDVYPVFYLYISEKIWGYLKEDLKHVLCRRLRLPFMYYFTVDHLDTAPVSHFYSSKIKRKKKKTNDEEEMLHLVKITPKVDVHDVVPLEQLELFHYFMRCMNRTRANESLIFQMEKWIPGCGIEYIKNGFRMFVNPRQHSENQLLEAYRLFISLPSFKECMIHHYCENWSVQFGLKDEEAPHLEEDEAVDGNIEKVDFDMDEDDDALTDVKDKRYWREKGGL